jgi:putative ATP-dependent endonuclease of the OLD family
MRIENVRIQNFRCFEDEIVKFNDYTCLVGANGSGKSPILTALRVFFRDTTQAPTDLLNLQAQDFYRGDTSREVVITVTFCDLGQDAKEDFKHYVRQEKLVVSAVASWNEQARAAEVKQYGERLVLKAFVEFFKAEGNKAVVADLRTVYAQLRLVFPELPPPGSKSDMVEALRAHESNHPELCELERSEDQFYGFTKGSNLLKKHVEWVFVPAVKDASAEQLEAKKSALGLLLERTVRSKMSFSDTLKDLRAEVATRYSEILAEQQSVLGDLATSLTARLREWAHPDASLTLSWRDDPSRNITIQEPQAEVSAVEGSLPLTISRMGHGLQRSFLLALLQELSGCKDLGGPKLLLACEEPELYQHPPQARHLSSVLQKLTQSNAQVLISTHSPFFVSGKGFPDVRLLRRGPLDDQPCVRSLTFEQFSRALGDAQGGAPGPSALELKIEQILQPGLREMFFAPVLILVEGSEDLGHVGTYFELTGPYDEYRRLGCHIVPTEGKGQMIYTLAVAKQLEIPTFVLFDADGDKTDPRVRAQNERENLALLRLCSIENPLAFPSGVFSTRALIVWPTQIGRAVREDIGEEEWTRSEETVRVRRGLSDLGNARKNALFVGLVLKELYESGIRSAILEFVCNRIISFAREERAAAVEPAPAAAAGEAAPH